MDPTGRKTVRMQLEEIKWKHYRVKSKRLPDSQAATVGHADVAGIVWKRVALRKI